MRKAKEHARARAALRARQEGVYDGEYIYPREARCGRGGQALTLSGTVRTLPACTSLFIAAIALPISKSQRKKGVNDGP